METILVEILVFVFLICTLFIGWRFLRIRKEHREICATAHLNELFRELLNLRAQLEKPSKDEEIPHFSSSMGLVVCYRLNPELLGNVFIHHLSISLVRKRLYSKSAAFLALFLIKTLGVRDWNRELQVSKRGVIHFSFAVPENEADEFLNATMHCVEIDSGFLSDLMSIKISSIK